MRTAIVSTYPPRACGIGTFAADVRSTLLGVEGVERVDFVAVVNEPSRPQRRGLLSTIGQSVRGDYMRTARMLGRLDIDAVLLQHEYGIFGGLDGEYVALVRAGAGAAARRDLAHGALGTDAAPARCALGALRASRAGDRDDRHRAAAARGVRSVRRGEDPRRAARCTGAPDRARARAANAAAPRARDERVHAVDVRADLARQGAGDGDRGAAGDRRAPSGGRLRDRRANASRRRVSGGRAIPPHARTARARARPRRARRVRRPLPLDRRALGSARRDRRLRHPVPESRADRLRRADVRDRGRLRGRLDAVLVRAGHARLGRRAGSCRSTTQTRSRTPCATTSTTRERSPRRAPRHGGSDRRSRGRRSPKRRRRCCARHTSSLRGADPPASQTSSSRACAPTISARSSTTSASCSTRTGSSRTATAAIASTTSRGWPVVSLALARRGDEQVWTSTLYRSLAFLHAAEGDGGMRNFMSYDRRWLDEPHMGDHVGRSVWALGEILGTAWIPAVVEPTTHPARPPRRRARRARSICERPRTPCSASRASTRTD